MGLQERNERLFYKVLMTHTPELLPVIDLPVRLLLSRHPKCPSIGALRKLDTCCGHCIEQNTLIT